MRVIDGVWYVTGGDHDETALLYIDFPAVHDCIVHSGANILEK